MRTRLEASEKLVENLTAQIADLKIKASRVELLQHELD